MRPAHRIGLVVAGGGGAVAVAILAATVGAPEPAAAPTPEDQVRVVLDQMNGSYNRSDFEGFASHMCDDVLDIAGFEAGWRRSRVSDGPTRIDVNSVSVAGGDAVATVQFHAANRPDTKTLEIDFLREGAEWKACRYHAPRSL